MILKIRNNILHNCNVENIFPVSHMIVFPLMLNPQDYIVTRTEEKIDCKILSTDSVYIYYSTIWIVNSINTMFKIAMQLILKFRVR